MQIGIDISLSQPWMLGSTALTMPVSDIIYDGTFPGAATPEGTPGDTTTVGIPNNWTDQTTTWFRDGSSDLTTAQVQFQSTPNSTGPWLLQNGSNNQDIATAITMAPLANPATNPTGVIAVARYNSNACYICNFNTGGSLTSASYGFTANSSSSTNSPIGGNNNPGITLVQGHRYKPVFWVFGINPTTLIFLLYDLDNSTPTVPIYRSVPVYDGPNSDGTNVGPQTPGQWGLGGWPSIYGWGAPLILEVQISKLTVAAPEVVAYAGDSITAIESSNNVCTNTLSSLYGPCFVTPFASVNTLNFGASGATTQNWVDAINNPAEVKLPSLQTWDTIAATIASNNSTIAHIMLGTNDSKIAVATTPTQYAANMAFIAAGFVALGLKVILSQPPWIDLNGSSIDGDWNSASLTLLQEYGAILPSVVNGSTIYGAASPIYSQFTGETTWLSDGVHPNALGASYLGVDWADDFSGSIF